MQIQLSDPMAAVLEEETTAELLAYFRELPEPDQQLLWAAHQGELDALAAFRGETPELLKRRARDLVQEIREVFDLETVNPRPAIQGSVLLPVEELTLSRFNPRKWRSPERIEAIAASIRRHGFDPSRAIKVLSTEEGFEIFAGGTRWEAAKALGLQELPCYVFSGLSPTEVAREADLDNDFDATHEPVSLVDLWEELARLAQEEGWTHAQIAQVKGLGRSLVSERCKWHGAATDHLREVVRRGGIFEGHVRAILALRVPESVWLWLSEPEAIDWLVDWCLQQNASVSACREQVTKVRDLIADVVSRCEAMEEDRRDLFLAALQETGARSLAAVDAADKVAKQRLLEQESESAAWVQEQLEAKEAEAVANTARLLRVEKIRQSFIYGDFFDGAAIPEWDLWISVLPEDLPDPDLEPLFVEMSNMAELGAIAFLACKDWGQYRAVEAAAELAGFESRYPLILSHPPQPSDDPRRHSLPCYRPLLYLTNADGRLGEPLAAVQSWNVVLEQFTERSLMALIESGSMPGQRVIDPFAGDGAVLVAAANMGRSYWGCEANADLYAMGLQLLLHHDQAQEAKAKGEPELVDGATG